MNQPSTPIYVINMASSEQRLEDVSQQLSALKLDFTRIDAVAGAELSERELAECYDEKSNRNKHHRNMTKGEIGCYMSHRKAWQQLIEDGAPYALIMEDDIKILPTLVPCLALVTRTSGWDMLKISDTEHVEPAEQSSIDNDFTLVSYKKVPNRAMAYFLSQEAAKKLLSHSRFFRPVDIDFQCYADFDISVCGLRPNCVEMSEEFGKPEYSDIARMNKGKHSSGSTFWRNIKYRLAMHKRRQSISYDINKFTINDEN